MSQLSKLPVVGNKKTQMQAKEFLRLFNKMKQQQTVFEFFMNTEFIYEQSYFEKIMKQMD
jgi:hypothetical protein